MNAGKHLKLAGLAAAGLCTVSIPVIVAFLLSTTGASDAVTLRGGPTPAPVLAAPRCEPERGYYALTFEDGPLAPSTGRLVAALRRASAVATFFDIGERAAALPGLVELQRRVGVVANHTQTHPLLSDLPQEERLAELQLAAKTLGYPNALVSPPYGASSPEVDADFRRSGLRPVYWTVDGQDSQSLTAAAIVTRALEVEPGGIVRLHDGIDATVEAIPAIVKGLRRRGMCPGLLAATRETVVAPNGARFNVIAVRP